MKSRAFAQFLWRLNIGNFEKACEKIKVEQPCKLDSFIKEKVKSKFLSDFAQFTPKAGRKLVKQLWVLIFPEWDIVNAMIFYSIRKEKDVYYKTKEEVLQAHRGVKFSDDLQALVI